MCGINGIFNFDGKPVARESLQAMNEKMIHRGPDDDGFYLDENLGLSMRRLSIIDLEGGKQPITDEDGTCWLVFNGEIFNYVELREGLVSRGHRFSTRSDTEVILHLYQEMGEDCVRELNGMFAFALWDSGKRELFLARDRLGVKPLFFSEKGGQFLFSSELRSLLELLEAPELDPDSYLLYLFALHVPCPRSIIRGVSKLEPGHYLKIKSDSTVQKRKYWDVERFETDPEGSVEDYADELLELLRDSIRLQKRSDVPVGTFLSGGVDSSAIVALLSESSSSPIHTFSVGYEGLSLDERPFARIVSERYQTHHHDLCLRVDDVARHLERVIGYMDEPLADSAMVPTLLLSEMARDVGVKVVLNGTGGDEIFGGYHRYRRMRSTPLRYAFDRIPLSARRFAGGLFRILKVDELMATRFSDPLFDFFASRSYGRGGDGVFKSGHMEGIAANMRGCSSGYCRSSHWYRQPTEHMYFDLKTYLEGDLLFLLDKMTMGASIEGRVPLLDHRIVERMFALPEKMKVDGNQLKVLFKRALKDHLPSEILFREKAGFGGPVDKWVGHKAGESLTACLEKGLSPMAERFFDGARLSSAIRDDGTASLNPQFLFAAVVFESWYHSVFNS